MCLGSPRATMASSHGQDRHKPKMRKRVKRKEAMASSHGQDRHKPKMRKRVKRKCTDFVALLRDCAKNKDLCRGTKLHDSILKRRLLKDCLDALVTMYAKCGALGRAKKLFDMYQSRDLYTWTALISGHAQKGEGHIALTYFEWMQREGLSPDAFAYSALLKACGSIKAAYLGEKLHEQIAKQGLLRNNIVLGNALVDMHAKCGALSESRRVLEELPLRNVITWTALMVGYVEHREYEQAFDCFYRMQGEGLSPDSATYACLLRACGNMKAAEKGEQIHHEIVRRRLLGNNVVGTALVDMYAKCGALGKARQVIEKILVRNVTCWNALIAGYVNGGLGEQALCCFDHMQQEGILPDATTYTCILKACSIIGAADKGEEVHNEIAKQGLMRDNTVLGNALVGMYAKCGALTKAWQLLDELPVRDVSTWTTLMAGYMDHGQAEQALSCFEQMQHEGLSPDAVSYSRILKACGSIRAMDTGVRIHDDIAKQGLLDNNAVLGTALVDMYSKCGCLAKAEQVLEELPLRDTISWTALISGYAEHGHGDQALKCFKKMELEGLPAKAVTFLCVLKACGSLGATEQGEMVHNQIAKQGLLANNFMLGNALVDMYAKCGALTKARKVLEELPVWDVISWNALMAGYVEHGKGIEAMKCFDWMLHKGIHADAATFSCLLNALSQSGLVDDAHMFVTNMSTKYGFMPDLEHYVCMVDLFGRAGHLDTVIGMMEVVPLCSTVLWAAALGALKKWGDGRRWVSNMGLSTYWLQNH